MPHEVGDPRSRISIVLPLYNEAANVDALFDRLLPVLAALGMGWEVVCVNDGSRDDTLARIMARARAEPRIKVVDFSRNFGKEAALTAGLRYAAGDAVVPMDGDLQHPPEVIPELVARWREGYDMVYAVRRSRDDQSPVGRLASKLFYWTFNRLTRIGLPRDAGDFRLLDRRVVDTLARLPERNRFMKGLFAWVGFRHIGVAFDVPCRKAGKSGWGTLKLVRFAFDGLTAFSNLPLRMWGVVGVLVSGFAFFYIVVRLIRVLLYGIDVPGYESILVAILFLGGLQLITLGIIGDYLGRVFDEVKGRPLYVVRETFGIEEPAAAPATAARSAAPPP